MTEMTASHRLRSPAQLRAGAEHGVAQVLLPQEVIHILDRLADAEAVERAAEEVAGATTDAFAAGALTHALVGRKTQPGG